MIEIKIPKGSVLNPMLHATLMQRIEEICQTANIQQLYVHRSAKDFCGEDELLWLRDYEFLRSTGHGGLILVGAPKPEERCQAITACLLRNEVDARITSLSSLLEAKEAINELPNPTVMVIPNLFVNTQGKPLTGWQIQRLYDLFLMRLTSNRPVVAYVESMGKLEDTYGSLFAEHLRSHFTLV